MPKGEDIVTKFSVDISDLKKGISDANQQIKLANAEFKKASAGMDDWAKSADGINAKLKQLDSVLAAQKSKVQSYKEELERNEAAYKENGARAEQLKAKLQELANNGVSKTSAEYKKYENELASVENAQAKNQASIDRLNVTILNQEAAVNKTEKEIRDYKGELVSLDGEQEDASKSADKLGDEVEESGKSASVAEKGFTVLKGALANLVADGFRAAINAAKEFAKETLETGINFDDAMSKVAAVSGAAGDDLQSLRDKAKEMGAQTKFSATESAEAFNYMAMAGWKTGDMLGGIEGLMSLAAASGEDLASTSDIVTDALTAFGMKASEAGHFSDVLAAASSNANTNVHMMGETFKYAAPMAGALGFSVEDVSIAAGLMANSGIKAGKAGSTLRNMLAQMANPTEKVAKAMDILGVSLDDGAGNMNSLMDIMQDLRSGFGNVKIPMDELQNGLAQLDSQLEAGEISEAKYNKAQAELMDRAYGAEGALKAQTAAMLVGKGGLSGLLAIVNSSDEDFNKLTEAVYGCEGAAQTMADTMVDNLGGDITMTKSAIEGLQLTLYETANGGLRSIVQSVKDELIPALSDMAKGTEGAGAAVGEAFSSVLMNAVNTIGDFLPQLGDLAVSLVSALVQGILDSLPSLSNSALEMCAAIIRGLGQAIPDIINKVLEILPALVDALLSGTDDLLNAAMILLSSIIEAIPSIVQNLVAALPQIINSITSFLTTSVPTLINGALMLFHALVDAIPQILPTIIAALPQIIISLVNFLIQSRVTFMQAAVQLLFGLIEAIPEVVTAIGEYIPSIIQAILDGLAELPSMLKDLFLKAWEGIKGVFEPVADFFKKIFGKGKEEAQNEWSDMEKWSDDKRKGIEKPFENTDKYFGDKFAASATAMDKSFAGVGSWADGKRKDVNKAFDSTDTWFGEKYKDAAGAMDKSFENVGSWADGKRKEVNTAFETTDEWFGKKYADSAAAMDKSFDGVGKWAEGKRKSVDDAFQSTDKWFGDKYEAAANQMDNSFKNVGSWAQGKRKSVDDAFASTDTYFKGKFDAAKSSMDTSWNDVGSWSEGKAQAMEKPFESVDDWFGKKFGETFKAIQDEFSGWESYWDGLYSTIVNKFKSIGTSVGSAIGGSFKTAMNAAMGAAQSAVNRGIDSINTAIGQMNAIQGVSVGRIGYVSFPRLARGGVLKKGQIGFLEGSGAEAVVPLDKNQKWISEVADDMVDALAKKTGSGGSAGKVQKQNTAEIKKLTKALEEQSKELDKYNEKLASTESQYIKNGDRIVKLTDKLETLKRNGVAESSDEYQKYATALEKAEEKQEKLETAIVNIYGSIENERNLIAETNAAISELDGTMQTNVTTTQSAAVADGEFGLSQDDVSAKVESLTGKLATQEERLEAYKKKLGDTEIAYVNNQARIDELTAKLENLQKKGVSPTSEEYLKYKDALDLAQQKQDYLQKSVDSLNVSIDFEQAAIVRTSGELSKYQGMQESNTQLSEEQAAAVQKIIDNMEKEGQTTDDLQARLSELNATLDAQQSKYDWTQAKLNKQTEALEAQSAKVDYLKEKMEQLAEKGVSKTDEKYVKYAEKLEKAEEKQGKLQESVAKLITSSEKQEAAIGKTSEEISNYEEALKSLGVTQGSMTDYTDDQVSSNASVAASESSLTADTERLDDAMRSVNTTYKEMAKLVVDLEAELKKLAEKYIAKGVKATKDLGDGLTSLRKPINDTMTKLDQLDSKLGTVYNTVIKKFKGIGAAVGEGISDAFKAGMNAAMKSAEKAINDGIDSINSAIDGMNAIDGGSIAHVGKVKFPQLARGGVLSRGQIGLLEGSGAEAVVPLDQNKKWVRAVANDLLAALSVSAGGIMNSSSIVNNKDYQFTQIINAPKAPSRIELYRQTRNLLAYASQG